MPELILEELLRPISNSNPGGEDLRYSAVYEKIKEARREDDDLSQGAWQHERKVADYKLVVELTCQAIAAQSKDLQLAAWLTEALVHEQSYAGLQTGLALCHGLIDTLWDHLFPALEDGDAEMRAAPLEWIGSRLDAAVRAVPLVRAGYDWFVYKESRALGYENPSATPDQKKTRDKILKEGRISPEAFDKSFAETPRAFYTKAEKDLDASLAVLQALDVLCAGKFENAAPGFGKLRSAIEEVRFVVHGLLEKKREAEPGPVAEAAGPEPPDPVEHVEEAIGEPVVMPPNNADSFAEANVALKAGRHQQALQILNRDLATQSCGRSRFQRKLQLARLCISAGKDLIAQPLLDDLAAAIDNHRLDEWEEHETVAAALVTILQSSKRVQGDAKEKQKFFERICRLDASQALEV
jgi:type VI secretion system protein ImpA